MVAKRKLPKYLYHRYLFALPSLAGQKGAVQKYADLVWRGGDNWISVAPTPNYTRNPLFVGRQPSLPLDQPSLNQPGFQA